MNEEQAIKKSPSWIDENQAASLLGLKIETLRKKCRAGEFTFKVVKKDGKTLYSILFASLNHRLQNRFIDIPSAKINNSVQYSEAPEWAKRQAEKYVTILQQSDGLKGKELKAFIQQWNKINPEYQTSYSALNNARIKYKLGGISALLANYGKTAGNSKIKDKYFEYFKNLYLLEGAPSVFSCWHSTLGYAMREDGILKEHFPKHLSFKRRLEREIPKQSIYMARYGEAKWNKKFANYVDRDYSGIRCGSVWVVDHAQIDIACENLDGKVSYPWVTAWRCFKSGKWLGWLLQPNNPNSDHIFQSFYYSADEYGIPSDVIIDNGRDFRAKDFAGGRKIIKINSDIVKTTSMLDELKVKVHFALPYNAQTKPIERDFLKVKELLSKHSVGYRGGNVTERPEKLRKEIAQGKILKFEEFKENFDDFIINVFNKMPSQGKNHKGKSPNELFALEFTEKRVVSKDALKLFCTRTSKDLSITRCGVKDSELGITYWADWMIGQKGIKVYLRRDVKSYQEAWVFNSTDNEFIGKAFVSELAPALADGEISKQEFKEAISTKKRNKKIAKAYTSIEEIELNEKVLNYKTVLAENNYPLNPKVSIMANSKMDKAVRKQKNNEKIGTHDLSIFLEEPQKEQKLYLFESDREIEKAEQEYLKNYGY